MTQPTHLRADYWAYPIPEDAWILKSENFKTDFVINMGYLLYPTAGKKEWLYLDGMPGVKLPGLDYNPVKKKAIKMPEGNWQIVCTSKECTEEIAKEIVDSSQWYFPERHIRYVDYAFPFDRENKQRWSEGFGTAKESLMSLLKAKNLNPDNTLILKKL